MRMDELGVNKEPRRSMLVLGCSALPASETRPVSSFLIKLHDDDGEMGDWRRGIPMQVREGSVVCIKRFSHVEYRLRHLRVVSKPLPRIF